MGTFNYNNMLQAEFEDRTLAHLERVIVGKMRRREAFNFAWTDLDGRRKSVWLSGSIPVSFTYEEPVLNLNRAWLECLTLAAASPAGLTTLPEPEEVARAATSRRRVLSAA